MLYTLILILGWFLKELIDLGELLCVVLFLKLLKELGSGDGGPPDEVRFEFLRGIILSRAWLLGTGVCRDDVILLVDLLDFILILSVVLIQVIVSCVA